MSNISDDEEPMDEWDGNLNSQDYSIFDLPPPTRKRKWEGDSTEDESEHVSETESKFESEGVAETGGVSTSEHVSENERLTESEGVSESDSDSYVVSDEESESGGEWMESDAEIDYMRTIPTVIDITSSNRQSPQFHVLESTATYVMQISRITTDKIYLECSQRKFGIFYNDFSRHSLTTRYNI